MKMLSVYQPLKNGDRYSYPWREAILSLLPIVHEYIVLEGFSDDGTYEALLEMQIKYPKIRIVRMEWYKTEPRYRIFGDLCNRGAELSTGVWHLMQPADEIYHEKDLPVIEKLMENETADWYSFGFYRLWSNEFDKVLQDKPSQSLKRIRMARKISYPYVHHVKDGFSMQDVHGRWNGKDVSDLIKIFHYSYTRHPKEFQKKAQYMMKEWFSEDRRFAGDRPPSYEELLSASKDIVVPFTEMHPAVMNYWIERQRREQ